MSHHHQIAKKDIHPKMYMYKRIVEAKLYIDRHYAEKIDLNNISDQASYSKYHFLRLFKKSFGQSPHQYLITVRLSAAKKMLKDNHSVKDTCFDVGFESVPSFVTLFKKREQMTPYEFLSRNKRLAQKKADAPLSFIPNCFVKQFNWDK